MSSPRWLVGVVLTFTLVSCTPGDLTVQEIVDRSIDAHGGDILNHGRVEFMFRDQAFTLERNQGQFSYARVYADSTGLNIRESITNEGYSRFENGTEVPVDSITFVRIGNQVNSVAYFTLLPIPLNDPAVVKTDLGGATILDEPYHRIGISFVQDGGGKDHHDEFVVWIHTERYTMDYFAYFFFTDDTGSRFRSLDGVHEVGGVRLNDYLNWTHDDVGPESLVRFDSLFQADALRLVSEVHIDSVRVTPLVTD